jgi:hypothetical protein
MAAGLDQRVGADGTRIYTLVSDSRTQLYCPVPLNLCNQDGWLLGGGIAKLALMVMLAVVLMHLTAVTSYGFVLRKKILAGEGCITPSSDYDIPQLLIPPAGGINNNLGELKQRCHGPLYMAGRMEA